MQVFTNLGGFFLDADEQPSAEALLLYMWVQGYRKQLGKLGVRIEVQRQSYSRLVLKNACFRQPFLALHFTEFAAIFRRSVTRVAALVHVEFRE